MVQSPARRRCGSYLASEEVEVVAPRKRNVRDQGRISGAAQRVLVAHGQRRGLRTASIDAVRGVSEKKQVAALSGYASRSRTEN